MADLARRSVAAQIGASDPVATAPGVTVHLLDPVGQFYVTGGPRLDPNTRPGDDPCLLWLAPDRALVVALATPSATPEGAFVSDVTDGQALFELRGERADELLAMGCTLDPRGDVLRPGRCAQTLFAGVKVVLYASGPDTFRLHAERSLAAYLLAWFTRAAGALQ